MDKVLAVFLGAGVGGVLRYLISLVIVRPHAADFPWATLLINLLGCLLIGYLGTFFAHLAPRGDVLRVGILVGLLGGFTTFSSFGRETFDLLTHDRRTFAVVYVLVSTLGGLLLVGIGHAIAHRWHITTVA
jgi:CrcB protein